MSLHASSSMSLWVLMELLTICLVACLASQSCVVVESLLKYFLVQAFGGLVFLFSAASAPQLAAGVLLSALLKLGVFPLSLWVVPLLSSQTMMGLWAVSTVMKAPGAVILSQSWSSVVGAFSYINIMQGAVAGVYFTAVKKMMAASSVGMTGWLALLCWTSSWPMFLGFYSLVVGSLIFVMSQLGLLTPHSLTSSGGLESLIGMVSLLSLAGVPPFSGFALKWVVLSAVSGMWGALAVALVPLLGISTYFYINMGILSMVSSATMFKPQMKHRVLTTVAVVNSVGLLVMALV